MPSDASSSLPKPPPRRTAERILDHTLELFNRYGEPNVSTNLISAELKISPGNLYYHFPAKEELVNALERRWEDALDKALAAAGPVDDDAGAWHLAPAMLRLSWEYRFIFRDLNDLLTRNRQLETRCQAALARQQQAIRERIQRLCTLDGAVLQTEETEALSTSLMVLFTYWLSFEYVRDPRHALEPENADQAIRRGLRQIRAMLWPYLRPDQRELLKSPSTV